MIEYVTKYLNLSYYLVFNKLFWGDKMKKTNNVYFIVGHHGIGKTYLLDELKKKFEILHIDTGPLIRKIYQEQTNGKITIAEWVKIKEAEYNNDFTNMVLCQYMEDDITNTNSIPIFITGNRSMDGIRYIANYFGFDGRIKIIYLDAPFTLLKTNYIGREKINITDEEFRKILDKEIQSGINNVKEYVLNNLDACWYCYKKDNNSKIYMSLEEELLNYNSSERGFKI